ILESFRGPLESVSPQHLRPLRREAAFSLANAKQHQSIPMIGLLTAISPLTDLIRSRWFALLAASMIGLFIAAAIITTDHYVIATGEVQPVERQEVFVAVEGAVQDILVEDGQPVQAGDVLMRLDSSELRSQSEQLAGQIASMSQRLAALSSMQVTDVDSDESASSSRLAMEFRQYSEEIGHLREQKTLIDEQIDQLTIRSPRDGVVMAWRLRERFLGRPLQRGNHVMTIGQLNDDWRLELRLPDRYAAEALQLINKETLDVSFVVATDPTKSFDAIVRTISRAVRKDQQGQYVHDVVALVGSEQKLEGLRGGANATAKIYVGERSILSSWTSDLVAFVHRRILFYL
ncbi:MAG: biotin/lipoyl-binding protein, partial [Planctomycetota bacterium]